MDIHPPEHPICSVRDFLVQIFTITCGIVIALALEGVVSGWREARLAQETRADFVAELTDNMARVETVHALAEGDEKWMKDMLAWGQARLKHQDAKQPASLEGRRFVALRNAAWETAIATQATRLLGFSQARALAKAYNSQAALNEMSARAREQWIAISGYSDADVLDDSELRDAARELRVALSYTYSLAVLEERVIGDYKAAQQELSKAE
jgi:hypothetical protein